MNVPVLSAALLAGVLAALPTAAADPLATTAPPPQRSGPARAAPRRSFDQLAREAAAARDQGRLDEALDLYAEALKQRPSWSEGWWYRATILYDLDRYDEARDAFRRVLTSQPTNAAALALKGLCEFQLRNYEKALVDLQKGRGLGLEGHQELSSVTAYHIAILLARFEQFETAFDALIPFALEGSDRPSIIEAFGITMLRLPFLPAELPPDRREVVLMAGRAGFHMAGRRKAAARKAFDELVARYPEVPNVHYGLGIFLLGEEPDGALEEFRRELKISPAHAPARLQMAFEYIKRGDYATARPLAEEAVELAPGQFAGRNALGRILLELGETSQAIDQLEAGVKLAPESPEMRFALARAYSRARRSADAERERAEFLRLDRAYKAQKAGPQAIGGIVTEKPEKEPPP